MSLIIQAPGPHINASWKDMLVNVQGLQGELITEVSYYFFGILLIIYKGCNILHEARVKYSKMHISVNAVKTNMWQFPCLPFPR